MKKLLIAVMAVAALSATAFAAPVTPTQKFSLLMPNSLTCSSVTLSGTGISEITGNTAVSNTSAQVFFLDIINLSTTQDIYCSQDSAVASSGAHTGVPISRYAGSNVAYPHNQFTISPLEPWYCVGTGTASLIVCLGK